MPLRVQMLANGRAFDVFSFIDGDLQSPQHNLVRRETDGGLVIIVVLCRRVCATVKYLTQAHAVVCYLQLQNVGEHISWVA